jgi:hypothetical protein
MFVYLTREHGYNQLLLRHPFDFQPLYNRVDKLSILIYIELTLYCFFFFFFLLSSI